MNDRRLLATGIIGTIATVLCCFTPILAVMLGLLGLSALIGYIDYVVMPALIVFPVVLVVALWRRQRSPGR